MSESAAYEALRLETSESGVTTVILDRPRVLNAMNATMHKELVDVFERLRHEERARAVVLTGEGRAFCSGADLKVERTPSQRVDALLRQRELVQAMIELPQPIVSAVRGAAIGSGLALALMADVSIVAEDARLADGNARAGVASGDHAVMSWPLMCGMARAKYYLLTGDEVSGREAERIGIVSRTVPAAEVFQAATEIAERLAAQPRSAVCGTKRAMNNWFHLGTTFNDTAIAYAMSELARQGDDRRDTAS